MAVNVNELSTEFDVLYNNITSNQAPGLNGYEKSVFLTKAQTVLIYEYFNYITDSANSGFDGNQKRQYDFSRLVTHSTETNFTQGDFDIRSIKCKLPPDWMLTLNEQLVINNVDIYNVLPISFREYTRLMSKPYKYPAKNNAWRIITDTNTTVEIIGRYNGNDLDANNTEYKIRYIKKPDPIILEDLSSLGVSINGETAVSTLTLPDEFYRDVLERAVTLAHIAWLGTSATQATKQSQQKGGQQNDQ